MKGAKDWFWGLLAIWIAAGLQMGLGPSFTFRFLAPDLAFTTTLVVCVFAERKAGALFGFLLGVASGAIVGVNMASIVFIRTLSGLGVATIARAGLDRNRPSIAALVAASSVVVQTITLFIAPKPAIGVALLATIFSAVANGVLAIPIYALLERLMDAPTRR